MIKEDKEWKWSLHTTWYRVKSLNKKKAKREREKLCVMNFQVHCLWEHILPFTSGYFRIDA